MSKRGQRLKGLRLRKRERSTRMVGGTAGLFFDLVPCRLEYVWNKSTLGLVVSRRHGRSVRNAACGIFTPSISLTLDLPL